MQEPDKYCLHVRFKGFGEHARVETWLMRLTKMGFLVLPQEEKMPPVISNTGQLDTGAQRGTAWEHSLPAGPATWHHSAPSPQNAPSLQEGGKGGESQRPPFELTHRVSHLSTYLSALHHPRRNNEEEKISEWLKC